MGDKAALIRAWHRSPSRYQQVAAELGQRITDHKPHYEQHAEMDPLPELCAQFDVTRSTILRAKTLLANYEFLRSELRRYVVN